MKRVFISFKSEDRRRVDGLRLLAWNPRFNVEFYDESVRAAINSTNAAYIRSRIREKISRTSVTLCLLSESTYTSEWVRWELEESIQKGNQIVAMGFPNGPERLIVPEPIERLRMGWHFWDLEWLQSVIG